MEAASEATGGKPTAKAITEAAEEVAASKPEPQPVPSYAAGDIDMRPAVQFVVDELYVAWPKGKNVRSLARKYSHPSDDELARIREAEEDSDCPLDPEVWLVRQALIELGDQVVVPHGFADTPLPGDTARLREELKRGKKSNPGGLWWRGILISPSERTKKPAAKKPAPKEPDEEEWEEEETETGQPDAMGGEKFTASAIVDYLERVTSWMEMVSGDEDGIEFDRGTTAEDIRGRALLLQAGCDDLIQAAAKRAAEDK